ncbi:MAG: hypothetical protein MUQ98_05670, partial [Loktanella sp.]|nr:hypothetical protein [Loktanella sp.]
MKRRQFLSSSAAALAATATLSHWPARAFAQDQAPTVRLAMPPLLDTRATGRLSLRAQSGSQTFLGGAATPTAGFNQDYLG